METLDDDDPAALLRMARALAQDAGTNEKLHESLDSLVEVARHGLNGLFRRLRCRLGRDLAERLVRDSLAAVTDVLQLDGMNPPGSSDRSSVRQPAHRVGQATIGQNRLDFEIGY